MVPQRKRIKLKTELATEYFQVASFINGFAKRTLDDIKQITELLAWMP